MKLSELINSADALGRLMEQPIKAKGSFRLAKAVKQVQPLVASYEETRYRLIKKYGEKGEEGEYSVEPGSKNWDKFVTELDKLLNEDVEVKLNKVTLSSIVQAELTAADAMQLRWLVKE